MKQKVPLLRSVSRRDAPREPVMYPTHSRGTFTRVTSSRSRHSTLTCSPTHKLCPVRTRKKVKGRRPPGEAFTHRARALHEQPLEIRGRALALFGGAGGHGAVVEVLEDAPAGVAELLARGALRAQRVAEVVAAQLDHADAPAAAVVVVVARLQHRLLQSALLLVHKVAGLLVLHARHHL